MDETSKAQLVKPSESSIMPPPHYETASTVLAAQAKAAIEARYVMAERHPRDLDVVREKLLKECKRPGFADVARYRKPVGKGVEGPSIRFAEAAIRVMSNVGVEQMNIYDDREKRIVRVSVVDYESNTPYSSDITVEKTVERRSVKDGDEVLRTRQNKAGNLLYIIAATEDDLLNKQNALISKAIRTNGIRLLPGDIVEECMEQVLETQQNRDAQDPDASKRRIFDSFAAIGIGADQLKKWLGHEANQLTQKEIFDLRGMYSAIRDGETTWREIMEGKDVPEKRPEEKPTAKSATEALKEQLKGADAARTAMKEQLGKKAQTGGAAQTAEIWPSTREPGEEE
jgi:hypothetical protein